MTPAIIDTLLDKGVLVSPEILENGHDEKIIRDVVEFYGEKLDVLDEEKIQEYKKINQQQEKQQKPRVKIIRIYDKPPRKRTVQDFTNLFNTRFTNIAKMLRTRQELSGITSISRINSKAQNERVALIGMIQDKQTTKNKAIILKMEDQTGTCTAIIRQDERTAEIYEIAKDLQLDEVIGITGKSSGSAIFVDRIIFPDVPLSKELKKGPVEEYVAFIGDTHFGSKVFMKEAFQKAIDWLNGKAGNAEQKEIAKKTNYVILTGDIVEGVGIYPAQEEDLEIKDIYAQYEEAARMLKQIPEHMQIIVMSGNHDAGRLSEPQERPFKDMAKSLWEMPNMTMLSNPAYVNIGSTDNFQGFDLLLYHGGSLIYYSENIPSIREAGGQKRSDLIMKYLLQRRHLAPTHGSTVYLVDPEQDYLLIDIVPDMFITGHIHRSSIATYRNVTMLNSSCWTETTDDQIKRGLEPLPARLPVVNLKTREVKVLNFMPKHKEETENDQSAE